MKTNKEYNFRVGDYVETASGRVGYITSITRQILNDDGDIFYQIKVKTMCNPEMNFNGAIESLKVLFNRIGKYDFTKPEQPKEIKKLNPGWRGDEAYRKINELVEAVNELRSNKKDESILSVF